MNEHLKQESFYTSPPFSYRPSIVEYLTRLKITQNGLIADLLYLDKLKKINILNYSNEKMQIEIKQEHDLAHSEDFLINILRHERDSNNYFEVNRLKKHSTTYEEIIIREIRKDFSLNDRLAKLKGAPAYFILGMFSNFILGIISSICIVFFFPFIIFSSFLPSPYNFIGALTTFAIAYLCPYAAIIYYCRQKLSKSKQELKFLKNELGHDIIKLYIISFFSIIFLSLFLIALIFPPIIIIPFIYYTYFYIRYGKIAKKFLLWFLESEKTREHRVKWLDFKDFVVTNSEIEKKPYKYYEIWEEFYYYTLAVGAIKNPTKLA